VVNLYAQLRLQSNEDSLPKYV